jgi:hypothetical protein
MSPRLQKTAQKFLWPLMPAGRTLLGRAATESQRFRCVFNAGAGEGGYSPLLLGPPGAESVVGRNTMANGPTAV